MLLRPPFSSPPTAEDSLLTTRCFVLEGQAKVVRNKRRRGRIFQTVGIVYV